MTKPLPGQPTALLHPVSATSSPKQNALSPVTGRTAKPRNRMPLIDPVTMSTPTRPAPDAKGRPLQPVVLFGSPLARAADALELLLLAGWLRVRFGGLVADPVAELKEGMLVLAGLQGAWVVLCCPPLGYHKKGVKPGFWVSSESWMCPRGGNQCQC